MLNHTPLYSWHKNAGAKFTDFGGWEMPVQYSSIVQEHTAVRSAAGLFDISHMGRILVSGEKSLEFLQSLCTNDIARCKLNFGMYSHLCKENGGVIDDIFVYFLGGNLYLVVVNASTLEKDFAWLNAHNSYGVRLENMSAATAMIAIQGPCAEKTMSAIFGSLPLHNGIAQTQYKNSKTYLCRTGYTGEDGFEIILPSEKAEALWQNLMDAGKNFGIRACGLGARDTLRLEAGFLLYGSDVDEDHTSAESGPSWVVKLNKGNFIGKGSLEKQIKNGVSRKLASFKLLERGIPRHGSKILCGGKEAGIVTSGTFSPTLQCGIAMGYISAGATGSWAIECHGKIVPAQMATVPFYKRSPNLNSTKEKSHV